jgi:S-adenosylmethionine hydrolase
MQPMLITLTSDFGYKDSFVGIMKGVIAGLNPQARIIDLSHGIAPQDVMGAALLLRYSVEYFPRGTVHVVVVDPGVGSARRPILVEACGYFLVGPDNGVLSLACKDTAELRVVHLSNTGYHLPTLSNTFHGRDVFAPVAAHLSLGADPASFGNAIDDFSRLVLRPVTVRSSAIEGEIVYIDGFGNLFTNIGAQELQPFAPNKVAFNVCGIVIQGLATHYDAAEPGSLVALINSWGMLEIALNQGNAQQRCAARIGDKIEARVL